MSKVDPLADFLRRRLEIFEEIKARSPFHHPRVSPPPLRHCHPRPGLTTATASRAAAAAGAAAEESGSIWVTLPDGARAAWPRGRTTPIDVVRNVSRRLADAAVAAKARARAGARRTRAGSGARNMCSYVSGGGGGEGQGGRGGGGRGGGTRDGGSIAIGRM